MTTRRGGERDLRWEGVYNPDLLLLCSCEINIAVCHKKKAQVNGGLVLLRHKKKEVTVETSDYTKRVRKLFKCPPQMSKVQNKIHNDRVIEPSERDCIVKCGIRVVPNGAEVVFHLGVATAYALTEFVFYWGSRSTALTDDQQFVDRRKLWMRGPWWSMAKGDNSENPPAIW